MIVEVNSDSKGNLITQGSKDLGMDLQKTVSDTPAWKAQFEILMSLSNKETKAKYKKALKDVNKTMTEVKAPLTFLKGKSTKFSKEAIALMEERGVKMSSIVVGKWEFLKKIQSKLSNLFGKMKTKFDELFKASDKSLTDVDELLGQAVKSIT